MNASIWFRTVLSCCILWNAAFEGLRERSTKGGQDKKPGTLERYGVVVVGFFAGSTESLSANTKFISLILFAFNRAARQLEVVRP